MTPMVEARGVSKIFEPERDLAARLTRRVAGAMGHAARPDAVRAVDRVDLSIPRGTVLGLVGESGCGKSTLGRMIAGILTPSAGTVLIGGAAEPPGPAARRARKLRVQMVFQDPYASLNPRMKIGDAIAEAPLFHDLWPARERDARLAAALSLVGLDLDAAGRFPHQFSGGQRARAGIARALAVAPDVLVCDEAVAALDVSIQAQILNLLMDLKRDLGLTCLFISHDLGVVEHISDRVAVMYLGRIVEEADTGTLFARAHHPYTRALLAERPVVTTERRAFSAIEGELPSPRDPPPGCHFHPRCPQAFARCRVEAPMPRAVRAGHVSACHLPATDSVPTPPPAPPARGGGT